MTDLHDIAEAINKLGDHLQDYVADLKLVSDFDDEVHSSKVDHLGIVSPRQFWVVYKGIQLIVSVEEY